MEEDLDRAVALLLEHLVRTRAVGQRLPGVTTVVGSAESLPHEDATFDACLANLVVHFMADPVAGLREMARVTRPGGTVAATVWQHATPTTPLTPFWKAVRRFDPDALVEECRRPGRPASKS